MNNLIIPNWPAPRHIQAYTTTRLDGFSKAPFDTFNLSPHVGDDHARVKQNLNRLHTDLQLPHKINWIKQVHGTDIVAAKDCLKQDIPLEADGMITQSPNTICAVLTADCLPLLLCDQAGTTVAAIHGGWRGIADGIIARAVEKMAIDPENMMAWLGPAIGPSAFEVASDVVERFVRQDPQTTCAFTANGPGRWLANLYQLAIVKLNAAGVTKIYGKPWCTYSDQVHFFSYRRDGNTGRMATIILLG